MPESLSAILEDIENAMGALGKHRYERAVRLLNRWSLVMKIDDLEQLEKYIESEEKDKG